jgi:hypothetical protein
MSSFVKKRRQEQLTPHKRIKFVLWADAFVLVFFFYPNLFVALIQV